ncbi:sorting nexin 2B-like isoform X2 [Olea europaea subsp. europaea]|uniref:Sorting nexin 2B-like isoform X2 n=1 Tax=Olea europaea subsp. europaea TaxID=158383 RepID=A0A8S0UB65_OLEEU|nr:sorting nexin 2B-like isoform X2 [Olea europaea subsp. europaea]
MGEEESSKEPMQFLSGNKENTCNDDVLNSNSYSSYRNVITTLSSSSENSQLPAAAEERTISDPLLFLPDNPSTESYVDVIFSPLDDGSAISPTSEPGEIIDELTILQKSRKTSSEYLNVTVSNPQKESESSNSIVPGGNTYVTYLITTNTNIPDYGGSDFRVRRRFKDLTEHPMIKKSDELRVFLTVQGRMPLPPSIDVASRMLDGATRLPKQLLGESRSMIEPQDVVQPAKGGRDLLRLFKELKQSAVNDWGGSKQLVEEEDKEFLEKKEKLRGLEEQLTDASKQAETLVKAQQDMGDKMGALGLAFIKLTKFENEQAVLNTQRLRAADMKSVATASVKACRLYRELNAQTVKHLDALHEHMGLMLAVNHAFSDRSSALLTVQTLISELSSLHSKAEKLETASSKNSGGYKSRIHKLEELKETIRVTEDAKSCAVKEYERIKENNRIEIERLDRERQTDFVDMLKGFVTSQVVFLSQHK